MSEDHTPPSPPPAAEPPTPHEESAATRARLSLPTPTGIGPPLLRGCLSIPLFLIGGTLLGLPVIAVIAYLLEPGMGYTDPLVMLGLGTGFYPLVIFAVLLIWRFVDKAEVEDLGYAAGAGRIARGLFGGFLLGGLILSTVLLAGVALGTHRVSFTRSFGLDLLVEQSLLFLALAIAAHYEEVVFRGYLLQNLFRRRPVTSLFLSSLPFALVHLGNPNVFDAGAAGAVLITVNIVLAGMWLGSAFILSGDLWLPTGLHLGWNWSMSALFGVPVSGMLLPGILTTEVAPESGLLGGVAFGLEGTLTCTVVMSILVIRGILRIRKDGRNVPIVENYTPHSASPPRGDRIESAEIGV